MADSEVIIDDRKVQKMLASMVKNTGRVSDRAQEYIGLLSSIIFRDIIDHFEHERGPQGRWQAWSKRYRERMIALGKGNNLILQDTGRLRQGFMPSRYRVVIGGVVWFNPVRYAAKHDKGLGGMPKRQFSWISRAARDDITKKTQEFILKF